MPVGLSSVFRASYFVLRVSFFVLRFSLHAFCLFILKKAKTDRKKPNRLLERVRDFLTESKTAHLRLFFIFFQSRSPDYAP
jgi:hypothetical protein